MEQVVQGGSLISSIIGLFFKGIDKVLDSAAEYEEEMGVLKQVNRIPLTDENGKETPYVLTVKLAPVRGKEGTFYVEAETTAPGLDVSSINKKVMKLDTSTKKSFVKMIDDLLEKNNLARDNEPAAGQSQEENSDATQQTEENANISSEQEQEIKDLIASAATADNIEYRTAQTEDGHLVTVRTKLEQRAAVPSICDLTIFVEDPFEQKILKSIKEKSVMVPAVDSSGATLGFETFCNAIIGEIDKYMQERNLTEKETRPTNSSTCVEATFVKSKDEVSYVAIKASCNIKAALDLISTVADDSGFVDGLPEETETSYRITDIGNSLLDVTEIEEVDTSSTYDDLFRAVSLLTSKLTTIRWAVGSEKWAECTPLCTTYWTCSSLLDLCAEWVVRHTDHYPCMQNPYGDDTKLAEWTENGKIVMDKLKQSILQNDVSDLVALLDSYYVNLECDEQNVVADSVGQLKRILTYSD